MTPRKHPPTRTLHGHPDLVQLKRQAKELLKAYAAGEAAAAAEVDAHYQRASPASFALHDAQLVLARAYGFHSWPKLRAFVDGVTISRLCEAVREGDLDRATAMLAVRPELVHLDLAENDEHRALHHAVLQRRADMVRLLMQHGADARKGIWPHRDATSPLTIAAERGYTDIVGIIQDEERRRTGVAVPGSDTPVPANLVEALQRGDDDAMIVSARRAIATGDAHWLRARHGEDGLAGQPGLVTHAVKSGRPDMLALLLDLGLDPDERERVDGLDEIVYSWGEPLRQCAISGQPAVAEILLKHGARPNTNVYAASSAMYEAYARKDWATVHLLECHGGVVNATTAGYLGLVDRATQLLADEAAGRLGEGVVPPGGLVATALLESAADGGHVELVRLALDHVDWPPGDARWQWMLMRPLGRHSASERDRYLACFRMILERSGVDVPGRFGRTLLHDVTAAWPRPAMGPEDRVAFATTLLDAGARIDLRDDLLKSTPLGWACRWGRVELVTLFLERGADPLEAEAEPWAKPLAWGEKMGNESVVAVLRRKGAVTSYRREGLG